MDALKIALHWKQTAGVTRQIVEAHACETQRVDLNRDGLARVFVDAELHVHREVAEIQNAVQVDEELVKRTVVFLKNLLAHAVKAVADVGLRLEDMMEDVDNVRLTPERMP